MAMAAPGGSTSRIQTSSSITAALSAGLSRRQFAAP